MGPNIADRHPLWTLRLATIAAVVGALVMMAFVIATYIERDVVRIRGLVLSFILLGLALIVRSEAHASVAVQRQQR